MKKQTLAALGLSLVFIMMAIFATVAPVAAKNNYGIVTTYEIPFDFYVNNKKMMAGEYEVQRISQNVYQIRHAELAKSTLVATMIQTSDAKRIKTAKLVFHRYGQHSFLRSVYTSPSANGVLLNESKTERRIRQESESDNNLANSKPTVIEIEAE